MCADRLTVAVMHPLLSQPVGDEGNALVLASRAATYGVDASVVSVHDRFEPAGPCIFLLGGLPTTDQSELADRLRADRNFLDAVNAGAPLLAVNAGLEVLTNEFVDISGRRTAGLGLLDATAERASVAEGPVVTKPNRHLGLPAMSGYESHSGRLLLGPGAVELSQLEIGVGNGGVASTVIDGACQGSVVGTWMHGPLLARNVDLADLLLGRALGRRLDPLDADPFADVARALRAQHVDEDRSDGTGWGGRRYGRTPLRDGLSTTWRRVRATSVRAIDR